MPEDAAPRFLSPDEPGYDEIRDRVKVTSKEADWSVEAEPAAATQASAVKAAQPNTRHFVTSISASYSAAQVGFLTLLAGAAVVWRGYVHNARDLSFASPIEIPDNTAVELRLAAGAAGVIGSVTVTGYSE